MRYFSDDEGKKKGRQTESAERGKVFKRWSCPRMSHQNLLTNMRSLCTRPTLLMTPRLRWLVLEVLDSKDVHAILPDLPQLASDDAKIDFVTALDREQLCQVLRHYWLLMPVPAGPEGRAVVAPTKRLFEHSEPEPASGRRALPKEAKAKAISSGERKSKQRRVIEPPPPVPAFHAPAAYAVQTTTETTPSTAERHPLPTIPSNWDTLRHPNLSTYGHTFNYFYVDQARSAFQKAARRGFWPETLLWGLELFYAGPGLQSNIWNRLLVISVEDIGLANPLLVFRLWSLARLSERPRDPVMFGIGAFLATESLKNRVNDWVIGLFPATPEYSTLPLPRLLEGYVAALRQREMEAFRYMNALYERSQEAGPRLEERKLRAALGLTADEPKNVQYLNFVAFRRAFPQYAYFSQALVDLAAHWEWDDRVRLLAAHCIDLVYWSRVPPRTQVEKALSVRGTIEQVPDEVRQQIQQLIRQFLARRIKAPGMLDMAVDKHTAQGQRLGRGVLEFLTRGSVLLNEHPQFAELDEFFRQMALDRERARERKQRSSSSSASASSTSTSTLSTSSASAMRPSVGPQSAERKGSAARSVSQTVKHLPATEEERIATWDGSALGTLPASLIQWLALPVPTPLGQAALFATLPVYLRPGLPARARLTQIFVDELKPLFGLHKTGLHRVVLEAQVQTQRVQLSYLMARAVTTVDGEFVHEPSLADFPAWTAAFGPDFIEQVRRLLIFHYVVGVARTSLADLLIRQEPDTGRAYPLSVNEHKFIANVNAPSLQPLLNELAPSWRRRLWDYSQPKIEVLTAMIQPRTWDQLLTAIAAVARRVALPEMADRLVLIKSRVAVLRAQAAPAPAGATATRRTPTRPATAASKAKA